MAASAPRRRMRLGCASDSDASDSDAACDSDAARPPAPTRMARETMAGDDWRPPLLQKAPNCKRFYRFSSSVSPTRHTMIGGRHCLQSPRVRRWRAESALRRPGARGSEQACAAASLPAASAAAAAASLLAAAASLPAASAAASRLSGGQPPQRRPPQLPFRPPQLPFQPP